MDVEDSTDSSSRCCIFLKRMMGLPRTIIFSSNISSATYLLMSPLDKSGEMKLPTAYNSVIIMFVCSGLEIVISSFAWWKEIHDRESLKAEVFDNGILLVNSFLHFLLIGLFNIGPYNLLPLTLIHILSKIGLGRPLNMITYLIPPIRKDWTFALHLLNTLSTVGLLSSPLRRYDMEQKSSKLQEFYLAIMMLAFSGLEFAKSVMAWWRERTNQDVQLKVEVFDYAFMLFISILHFIVIGLLGVRVFYMSPLTLLFLAIKYEFAKPHNIVAYFIPRICKAYEIVVKHKKQAFQALLLALEVISFVLEDLNAKGKQGFHIALLCLSLVGFAWTTILPVVTYYATRRARPRSQVGCIEFFLSLFQLITAIPPVFKFNFDFDLMKLLPLIFAITNVIFGFKREDEARQAPAHARCVSCLYDLQNRRKLVV